MVMVNETEFHQEEFYYMLLMTMNVSFSFVIILAACLCCKKNVHKNDLMGLEGMVKLKNPDEVMVVTIVNSSESHGDLNTSTASQGESEKRASTAAHRSLPDIPVAESNGDNGSELYETVADKTLIESQIQNKSPNPSLKKQVSVSQHSSMSQADDVSSPYSRVKNSPHDYAKLRPTEHPYAQLNAPSISQGLSAASNEDVAVSDGAIILNSETHNRNSQHSNNSHNRSDSPQVEIPAASAIAGMVSASQDLPYMTPPITNQHFSGDSQDSSKGYTSISVREPLNILAQQQVQPSQKQAITHSRDVNDSHYATVSDDSDETYAAIEDPNLHQNFNISADIYTSGSETYAQIQPMQIANSVVISVEINNASTSTLVPSSSVTERNCLEYNSYNISHQMTHAHTMGTLRNSTEHSQVPVPPLVDNLRAQIHSRQASSCSNNSSSMCNLGSPKPEKRQANSPLPPTPKTTISAHLQTSSASTSNLTSGRNSVISVIECDTSISEFCEIELREKLQDRDTHQHKNKSLSPCKDIEGMYAKVMKKNKLTRNSSSSNNSSPVMARKLSKNSSGLKLSPLDTMAADLIENKLNTICASSDRSRIRSNSYGTSKDHGYETIPADAIRLNSSQSGIENRRSDGFADTLQRQRQEDAVHNTSSIIKPPIAVLNLQQQQQQQQQQSDKYYEKIILPAGLAKSSNDPGYETLLNQNIRSSVSDCEKYKLSDYDPNYEVLKGPHISNDSGGASDDGYAKVLEKISFNADEDSTDGYSKVKGEDMDDGRGNLLAGYSTIADVKGTDANHNYASILETKREINNLFVDSSDHYARIAEKIEPNSSSGLLLSSSTKSVMEGLLTPSRTIDFSTTLPTSVGSSSLLNISSLHSSTSITSTSTISSRQTPTSASQYESLTNSETDPNYESVCYLNSSSQENPYERLHTDFSDTQMSSSSPLSSDAGIQSSNCLNTTAMKTAADCPKSITADDFKAEATVNDTNPDALVDDYFQV
ncbi:uncharacterized protein ACN2A1_008644 isoform 1-T1 [Glossina fuscipes fuscipes]